MYKKDIPKEFIEQLTDLINHYSLENMIDAPDFIIAEYLVQCLNNASNLIISKDKWFKNDEDIIYLEDDIKIKKSEIMKLLSEGYLVFLNKYNKKLEDYND